MAEWKDGDRVMVSGYSGVAFYVHRWQTIPDEDTEWSGIENETGMIEVVMVGDDRVFVVDPDDLTAISEDDYCPECGQIGCTAYAN